MSYKFIIGVEGGGSTCRVVLGRPDGQIIDRLYVHESASLAAYPLSTAIATLKTAIDDMLAKHGIRAAEAHIALCLPGVSRTDRMEVAKRELDAYYQRPIPITSDAMAALLNVSNGLADGTGIVIAGTGSILLGHDRGTIYRLGGKGYPNDAYSGAGIVRDCLAAYLRAGQEQGLSGKLNSCGTPLAAAFEAFVQRHGKEIDAIPARVVASLFPAILDHVAQTPQLLPCIKDVFDRHLERMAGDINRFCRAARIKHLGITGSVAQRLVPLIADRLPAGIATRFQVDAIDGAFAYALQSARDPYFLQNLPVCALDLPQAASTPKPGL